MQDTDLEDILHQALPTIEDRVHVVVHVVMLEDLEVDVVQAMCKAKLVVDVRQEPCSIEDLELIDHQVLLIVHHVIPIHLIHLKEVVQIAVLVIVIGLFLIHQVPGFSIVKTVPLASLVHHLIPTSAYACPCHISLTAISFTA